MEAGPTSICKVFLVVRAAIPGFTAKFGISKSSLGWGQLMALR